MYKTLLAVALVALVGYAGVTPAYAVSREDKQARFTEKVRAGIAKLGTGEQARIQVKLIDKTRLDGYVSEATQDDFVVVNRSTGAATRVTYAQVKQVKGNNLSTGAKVAIGLAVLAAILAIFLFLENYG
jgi:NMD protein affecting ribosome stability and mRNA decay